MKRSQIIDLLWRMALQEVLRARSEKIQPEHFLQALTKGNDFCQDNVLKELKSRGFDAKLLEKELRFCPTILNSVDVNPVQLRRKLRSALGVGDYEHPKGAVMHRSARTKKVFGEAEKLAAELGYSSINAGILFVAILSESDSLAVRLLAKGGADADQIKSLCLQKLRQDRAGLNNDGGAAHREDSDEVPLSGSMLDKFGRDLTQAAREGLLPPVIGRRKELLQVIQTLGRSSKSNPVLIGEAGVGKTAIVEALAQRAVAGKEEQVLGGRRIIEINMSAMVAGTKYRGEFEERMQKLLKEVQADPNIILFIDEIHTMVGAGDRNGPMDAANIMKPALARGTFKCIGATTTAEYRKFIEKDPALERRFNKVVVGESSRDETVEILKGLRSRFEKHHNAQISDAAIEAAVDLTIRFDTERYLPDKALDVLDMACVQICVPGLSIQVKEGQGPGDAASVTPSVVIAVMAEKYGIPEDVISGSEGLGKQSGMAELRENLKKRVMGQDQAIEQVYRRLRLSYAALSDRRRPLGVFLFLGPSGVGKTELARALADTLFGAGQNLIRLDMSEYMEPHNVARLIGSPPGYVGHEEGGQLTDRLRKTPHALVLLDEIEKAHPKVLDLFLQVFDDGRITDSKGKTIDAKNAVFIMTSNLGNKAPLKRPAALGFNAPSDPDPEEDAIHQDVKHHFRTELINRIDAIIRFNALSDDALHAIAKNMFEQLNEALLSTHNVSLSWEPGVIEELFRKARSVEFGARNLRRVVQDLIELPLLDQIGNDPASAYVCRMNSGNISISPRADGQARRSTS